MSLLPVVPAAGLMQAGLIDRGCWVVPRDSLRLQSEEAFGFEGPMDLLLDLAERQRIDLRQVSILELVE